MAIHVFPPHGFSVMIHMIQRANRAGVKGLYMWAMLAERGVLQGLCGGTELAAKSRLIDTPCLKARGLDRLKQHALCQNVWSSHHPASQGASMHAAATQKCCLVNERHGAGHIRKSSKDACKQQIMMSSLIQYIVRML